MKSLGLCANCPYSLDDLLVKNRRVTVTRLSDDKVVVEVVSDSDPRSKSVIEDRDVVSCLCRIPK